MSRSRLLLVVFILVVLQGSSPAARAGIVTRLAPAQPAPPASTSPSASAPAAAWQPTPPEKITKYTLLPERLAALTQAIDDKFEQLTRSIAATKQRAEQFRDNLSTLKAALPSVNDISKDLQLDFTTAHNNLRTSLASGEDIAATLLPLIENKGLAPNVRVDPRDLPTATGAAQWDTTATGHVADINEVIRKHNSAHDQFSETQESARKKLKEHFLADGQAEYRTFEAQASSAKKALEEMQARHNALMQEAEEIRQDMRQHGPAADIINRGIRSYLGHKELRIVALESGYEIRRNGNTVTGSLSESEKTAIALCYFLTTLEAEGRQLKNLIVVVDDPISSLDTKALHYAFTLLSRTLDGAGQLIILTHNLQFMNEVKKWLKNKAEKGAATLLFLDAIQDAHSNTRTSSIRILPTLIREYESEYQYLFHLVQQFSQSADAQTEYFYLMPNALRKLLDIFLAFKVPGSAGLSNKVDKAAKEASELGLDPARIRALDRLVQLESHADNLDDLVTLSSLTIEETKDAAQALLTLMETLDRDHYKGLCRLSP